jgi:hypothetical protein
MPRPIVRGQRVPDKRDRSSVGLVGATDVALVPLLRIVPDQPERGSVTTRTAYRAEIERLD